MQLRHQNPSKINPTDSQKIFVRNLSLQKTVSQILHTQLGTKNFGSLKLVIYHPNRKIVLPFTFQIHFNYPNTFMGFYNLPRDLARILKVSVFFIPSGNSGASCMSWDTKHVAKPLAERGLDALKCIFSFFLSLEMIQLHILP